MYFLQGIKPVVEYVLVNFWTTSYKIIYIFQVFSTVKRTIFYKYKSHSIVWSIKWLRLAETLFKVKSCLSILGNFSTSLCFEYLKIPWFYSLNWIGIRLARLVAMFVCVVLKYLEVINIGALWADLNICGILVIRVE